VGQGGRLDLGQLGLRLLDPAVGQEPPRALGERAPHHQDDQRQHRAHQEGEPPPDVDGEGVEEDQRGERAEDRTRPVRPVDPDVDSPPVLGRHHLVDGRVDRRVLAADAHAGHQPGQVEEHQPAREMPGDERRGSGAEQVEQQRRDQQPLPAQFVGHPPEHQRPHHLADQVHRRDQTDLGRGHVQGLRLGQLPGDRAGDRDLQPVENPRRPQPGDHPGMERGPAKPIEPGRDRRADLSRNGRGVAHRGRLLSLTPNRTSFAH
jgi:hypothetical protein